MDNTGTDAGRTRGELRLSENARRVLEARYLKKDKNGNPLETAEEMFRRVARTIASVEARYGAGPADLADLEEQYYELMASGQFMPNSPTLMNAGREMGMLSACFVLPVRDSIDEIFESIKHTALIQKAGGGTGFAFDELRPTGDYIRSSGGTTSGPISFWRAFSEATNAIQQGAFRRGANMGMMYIHHPDILKFIHAKQDLQQFTNYNISVKITDAWMDEFLKQPNSPHVARNPRTGEEFYFPRDLDIWSYTVESLLPVRNEDGSPREVKPGSVYTRQEMWDLVVRNAHATGEPGVVFMDRINRDNPTPHLGRIEATNPCGEQPLLPYEACNLGSVNVGYFVGDEGGEAAFDWDGLGDAVDVSVRFLDDVIDANRYPLPQIEQMCKANRKIGLGVMGFADALFKLGIGYNTDEAVRFAEALMKFVNERGHRMSEKLARERGCFPNWQGSVWDTKFSKPMRNAAVTTVAPTGTISILANCSSGIEPLFSLVFYRNVLKERKDKSPMLEINEQFRQAAVEQGFYSEDLMSRIAKEGTLAHVAEVPDEIKQVFVCAHDIEPQWHLKMQAAFQRHCDASISKTINFPHDAKVEDVDQIYREAYRLECKGITVYRDGCRQDQPMATEKSKKATGSEPGAAKGEASTEAPAPKFEPVAVPECLPAVRIRQVTPFGHMHVSITVDPRRQKELEVFAQLGKGGDVAASDLEAICRMISLFLRSGGSLRHVIDQLKDIGSSLSIPSKGGRIMSLGDGLAKGLQRYQKAKQRFGLQAILLGEADLAELDLPTTKAERKAGGNGGNGGGNGGAGAYKLKCPECGGNLTFEEGCVKCHGCGYAQC
ncbi:MAG: vitamin B12-dependent ribonucleotide reductase [Phycisphaerae bacterium]|nr:vitamin B12-dependent ribonucleotide reductase [Phycisphaerae bacterium]